MKYRVAIVTMVATLAFCGRLAAQTTFYFQFNDAPNSLGTPPTVGTGTFTFATDPGDGTFPVSDLGSFSMNYNFNDGDSFDQSDITSDLSLVSVVLSGSGPTRRLQFDDTGAGGGGPYNGSLDLTAGGGTEALSFEPSYYGDGLQLYEESDLGGGAYFGDYLATASNSIPDGGSTIWLLGIGCFSLTIVAARPWGRSRRFGQSQRD